MKIKGLEVLRSSTLRDEPSGSDSNELKKRFQPRLKPSLLRFFTVLVLIVLLATLNLGSYSVPEKETVLSSRTISLETRQYNKWVNDVFADNILLNVAYMRGIVHPGKPVDWTLVKEPFEAKITLEPGKTFAYHEDVLAEYQGSVAKTTNAHFNGSEGFKSDGYLMGDGVCHLASLLYWAAKDAELEAKAPSNHNFAAIPEVPKEYGVAIYFMPGNKTANALQNLYVKNNKTVPVEYKIIYDGKNLTAQVVQLSTKLIAKN